MKLTSRASRRAARLEAMRRHQDRRVNTVTESISELQDGEFDIDAAIKKLAAVSIGGIEHAEDS